MKKIRKRICQLLIGLIISPFLLILLPIVLVIWLGGKIVEYAHEKL